MITLDALSTLIPGELKGDVSTQFSGVSTLENASKTEIAFLFSRKHVSELSNSKAGLVIMESFQDVPLTQYKVKDVRYAQYRLMEAYYKVSIEDHLAMTDPEDTRTHAYIHPDASVPASVSVGANASIDAEVEIGENTVIGPNAVLLRGCRLGKNTVIGPGVVVYPGVSIGSNVIIKANAVLGSDGFGFYNDEGAWKRIPQIGQLIIEDDVEIGAGTAVDRGSLDHTVIKRGSKLDNLIQIAHNCKIGQHCAMASHVGMAGSIELDDHVIVGGQAGFSGHLKIGKNTVIYGRSGVTKDFPDDSVISGFPAQSHKEEMGFQAKIRRFFQKK